MSAVRVLPARVRGRFHAPPSKSYTHRALVAAYLAKEPCEVLRPLDSDDTRATRRGIQALGATVVATRRGWKVGPEGSRARPRRRVVFCRASGTTLRFLSAVAALDPRPTRFEGAPRLAERPIGDLYQSLRHLGAHVASPSRFRGLPCVVRGPIHSGQIEIRGDTSSQFTSAMLMVLPTVDGPSTLHVLGQIVSRPYVAATLALLQDRGVKVRSRAREFAVPGGQSYQSGPIVVPGDASSAAYVWAAAAATQGRVDVEGVPRDLPQADLAILPILEQMGARVEATSGGIRVSGRLDRPVSVDMTDTPDLFPLVAVLAALVAGRRSRLRGAPQLVYKESDRRLESVRLARAVGGKVSVFPGHVDIVGTDCPRSLDLPTLDDHRLVMSAAVAALAAPGPSRLGRREAVTKSFPGFWDALAALTEGEGVAS